MKSKLDKMLANKNFKDNIATQLQHQSNSIALSKSNFQQFIKESLQKQNSRE
jgi:hypothetical protein